MDAETWLLRSCALSRSANAYCLPLRRFRRPCSLRALLPGWRTACSLLSPRDIATDLVEPERKLAAIALVFLVMDVALVTGVSLGGRHRPELRLAVNFPWRCRAWRIGFHRFCRAVAANLNQTYQAGIKAQLQVLTFAAPSVESYLITAVGYGRQLHRLYFLYAMLNEVTASVCGAVSPPLHRPCSYPG